MHDLTPQQERALDRIGSSPAGPHATVVGWADGGPVLRVKQRLIVLTPSGDTEDVLTLTT